ncbi:hypothetical protein NC653_018210 [Populus alba x Populus x berolinensis]|uniref:Uncharacterized protein n=1 Tax=Populus alba x Populus x berolinensis TaxID=444605 RepID=A0AAD6QFZ7_9ROSI|nr:hypothetical protein NC653_018210 [Populus alba x Populus x berolinensis]
MVDLPKCRLILMCIFLVFHAQFVLTHFIGYMPRLSCKVALVFGPYLSRPTGAHFIVYVARPSRGDRWQFFVCFSLIGSLESPPSIMVTRNPNSSFRDSKVRDWLRKGKGKKDLPGEAAAGGEVEEDDWLLLTKDTPACCSWWSQVCWLLSLLVSGAIADKTGNGGLLVGRYFSYVSCVAGRVGLLLLIQLLWLRKGVASASSITVVEELELAMTAPLLVLVPSVEKKTQLLLVMGKRYRRLGCVAGVETRLVAILDCCCD